MEHLTDTFIDQYRSGMLEEAADYARVEQHLRTCADCEARLRRGSAPASATLARALHTHTHPEDALLLRYARNAADASAGVAGHVDHCARCQEDVAHLRAYLLAQTASPESRQSEPSQSNRERNERTANRFSRRALVFGLVPAMVALLLFFNALLMEKRPGDLSNKTSKPEMMSPNEPVSGQTVALLLIQPTGQIKDSKPKFRWQHLPGAVYVVKLTDAHYNLIRHGLVQNKEEWDCPISLNPGNYTWELAAYKSMQAAQAADAALQSDAVNSAATSGSDTQNDLFASGDATFTVLNPGGR